jgi:hypothetical protein
MASQRDREPDDEAIADEQLQYGSDPVAEKEREEGY